MMADDSLTALKELVARMPPGPIYAVPVGAGQADLYVNDGKKNPGFDIWNEANASGIVAAHRLLTYIADPKAEEALAKKIDPHAFAITTTGQYTCWNGDERRCLALAAADDQLNLLARKAMGTE